MRSAPIFVLCASAALSCRRTPDVVKKDEAEVVIDAAKPAPVTESSRALLHGRVVDLATGNVLFPLRDKLGREEVTDGRSGWVHDLDGTLRGYDLATGKLEKEIVAPGAKYLAMDEQWVAFVEGTNVSFVSRKTGVVTSHPVHVLSSPFEEMRLIQRRAVLRHGLTLAVVDPVDGPLVTTVLSSPPETSLDSRWQALIPSNDGFCVDMFEPPDHVVRCYDLRLHTLRTSKLTLSKPSDPPGTRMSLRAIGRGHVVIGTWSFGVLPAARRSAVVRLSDGKEVARVEDEVVAVVERPDGTLESMVVIEPEIRLLDPGGAERWRTKPKWPEHFAQVVTLGDRLVLATYNMIATGVQIFALSKTDGHALWVGETKLPPIGHSKYHNAIELALRGDAVILRGHESSVEHVHLYDVATGALRFSDAPPK